MSWLKTNKKIKILLLTLIFLGTGFFVALPALAQINTGIEFGQYTGLVNTDIRIIIAKIIRVALGLLGVVALGFIIYGGYMYMTSEGNEKKLEEAKKILKNAVIGLVIILSAFSIAQFIITRLTGSIINDFCIQNPAACVNCLTNPSDPSCSQPICTDPSLCPPGGNVFYGTVVPQGSLPIYNVVLNIRFFNGFGSADVNRTTVNSSNISIVKQLPDGTYDSNNYPGTFEFIANSEVAFHPQGYCGAGNPNTDCFATNTTYRLTLDSNIKSASGDSLDCINHSCVSTFTTGDKYDAAPPQVEMVLPGLWAIVGENHSTTISANYSDDSGVKQLDFITKQNQITSNIIQLNINPYEAQGYREYNNWVPHLTNPEKAETAIIAARAYDLDNHQTTSTIQNVKILPAYCFNGTLDTNKNEEEVHSADGITPDCGLNSECGACSGERCYTNFTCAGGYCDVASHQCVTRPKILNVAPLQAGAGSLITVKGLNFGSTSGHVFLNNIEAPIAACPLTGNNPTWSNTTVIVRVPTGNTSGTVELRTDGYVGSTDVGHFDRTDDTDWGFKGSFIASGDVLPGLLCVNPTSEAPFNSITLAGENFGSPTGKVNFSNLPISSTGILSWAGNQITAKVPQMPAQTLSLSVKTSDLKNSNAVPFTVKAVAQNLLPRIDSLDPENGPIGTYLTISGDNFGSSGSVIFKVNPSDANESGAVADLPPSYCSNSWQTTQIIVKVPASLLGVLAGVSTADYFVQVKTTLGNSNWQKFTINKNPLQPGLCSITPTNGPANTIITLQGEGFGSAANNGAVEYSTNVTSSFSGAVAPRIWDNLKIVDAVPFSAKTGKVKVWSNENNLYSRNSVNFKVQNCKEEISSGKKLNEVCAEGEKCCDNGSCVASGAACPGETGLKSSMFAWSFSADQLPVIPRIVEECVSGKVPSPSPSQLWEQSNNVCVNAQVTVRFTSDIVIDSNLMDNFIVQKSSDGNNWTQLVGSFSYDFWTAGKRKMIFNPYLPVSGRLEKNTFYRVLLTTNLRSYVETNGVEDTSLEHNMLPDTSGKCPATINGKTVSYCFNFKTRNNDDYCKLGSAVVSPEPYTANLFNNIYTDLYNISALADDNKCWSINASNYDWQWNAGTNVGDSSIYASVSNNKWPAGNPNVGRGRPVQDLNTLDKITPSSGEKVWAQTTSDGKMVRDNATLYVFPSKPKIINYYPTCSTACINSSIALNFDIRVKGVGSNFQIYKCPDEDCHNQAGDLLLNTVNYSDCNGQSGSAKACRSFNLSLSPLGTTLLPNIYYRVVLYAQDTVKSEGGVSMDLADLNYNCGDNCKAFSWIFRTKNDPNACKIDRVQVLPATSTVYWIGSRTAFSSYVFGAPDNCSSEGQKLNAFSYNWSWQSQNPNIAAVTNYDLGTRRGGSSALTTYCGDGLVQSNAFESCDSNTNCTPDCQIYPRVKTGTNSCVNRSDANCCGNGGTYGGPEKNEECDLGNQNGLVGKECSSNCLFTTTNTISLAHCLSTIGGDTATKETRCLNIFHAVPVCGNGIVETGEECDGGANCAGNCLLTTGFETALGDGKIDPLQYATAIGSGTPDANKQQKTQIYADTAGKRGMADFILQCGYNPVDSSCPGNDLDKGAGKNSCCYERPTVVEDIDTLPRAGLSTNICPNALITIKFDEAMDESSFTSTTLGYYNIALAKVTSTPNCPPGTYLLGQKEEEPHNFWQKIVLTVRHLFGLPAQAQYFCAGDITYDLKTREIASVINGFNATTTQAILELKEPLIENTTYRLVVFKESRNLQGVRMQNSRIIDFRTANNLCKIDHLSLNPTVQIFTKKNEAHQFNARPEFVAPGTSLMQELMPMPGAYNWEYSWVDGDFPPPDIISVNSNNNQAAVSALGKNGDTTVGALARITEDASSDSTVGKIFSATSTISVFLCENPWPSLSEYGSLGLGYFDAGGNNNGIYEGNGWTNFKLLYCRDAGKDNDSTDDLGALNLNTPLYHRSGGHQDASGVFKEFFFTFANNTNRDSIGLRIYPNPNYLSTQDWYNSQPWIPKGSTNAVRIGSDDHIYQVLQEGRTYYINGLNFSPDNKIYSNIYVFSFSDNPSSETLNVVTQLLNNFTLNVNFTNKSRLQQINRDFVRFKDLKMVSNKLTEYYLAKGFFPKLNESTQYGTFLPAYTNSKWQSWQLLSNSLGFGMPIDPLNTFYGCGNNNVTAATPSGPVNLGPYNVDTCWNESNATFICPSGSHIYQYQTTAGVYSVVKADLEITSLEITSGLNWAHNLKDFLDIKLCNLSKNICKTDADCPTGENCSVMGVDFQLANSCDDSLLGQSSTCGDGVVGGVEQCEIDQTRLVSCTPVNDPATSINESAYVGQLRQQCQDGCLGWNSDISDLIGRWTFNTADVSGNTILDKSGYKHNGTNTEGFSASGELGEAWSFNGTTSYVDMGNVSDYNFGSSDFSVSLWFKTQVQTARLIGKRNASSGGSGWDLLIYNKKLYVRMSDGAGDINIHGSTDVNDNNWHNFIFTTKRSGDSVIYLDGQLEKKLDVSSKSGLITNNLNLFLGYNGVNGYYKGLIDDVRIYNRSLTTEEILIIKNKTLPNTSFCSVKGYCGDGTINGVEACDDGVNNGKYGYCNNGCVLNTANKCGDQHFTKESEACDSSAFKYGSVSSGLLTYFHWIQDENNSSPIGVLNKGWCDNNNLLVCSGDNDCLGTGHCVRNGAKYGLNKDESCTWDCQGRDYCGDGIKNSAYEECEKNETCQVGTCSATSIGKVGRYCEEDSDCSEGLGCINSPQGKTCNFGNYQSCNSDADCFNVNDYKCENYTQGKKYCVAADEKKYIMFGGSLPYFKDATTTSSVAPFASIVYSGTEKTCHWERSAVTNGTTPINNFSTPNISCLPFKAPEFPVTLANCGIDADKDGNYKDPGEECDFGPANGNMCAPSGTGSCTYCGFGCKNLTITSKFTLNVAVQKVGTGGTGTVGTVTKTPQSNFYFFGDTVTLEAIPQTGYKFEGWIGNVVDTGLANTTITIKQNESVTAKFSFVPPFLGYILTTSTSGGGEIIVNPEPQNYPYYTPNTSVSISAQGDSGYTFTGWTGDLSGLGNPDFINMDSDKNIVANFGQSNMNIVVAIPAPQSGGSVEITPSAPYNFNDLITFTAVPSAGYKFLNWTESTNGDIVSSINPFSVYYNDISITLNANFESLP